MRAVVVFLPLFFPSVSSFTASRLSHRPTTSLNEGYVPDGMTPGKWEKQKYKDSHKPKGKHFKSRSFKEFQEELNRGRVRHLFPVMNAKKRVNNHQIHPSDIPYMQRVGGSYDNEDVNVGYVPDGMTPHQWHDIRRKERNEQRKKEFGRMGPKGFKSRSLQAFQQDLEKGKVGHLLPVMFAKDQLKKGLIKNEDVPYMQRGGNWDNSDVKGANKIDWTDTDKKYETGQGPFSFLKGSPKTQAPPTMEKEEKEPRKKGFFGLFP